MALDFLSNPVADLALGKPPLSSLPSSSSVLDALRSLKLLRHSNVSEIGIWDCLCSLPHSPPLHDLHLRLPPPPSPPICRCIGKVCMQNVVCYLASDENLLDPARALRAPVTALLGGSNHDGIVQHIDSDASLLEAFELIVKGAQNLIFPITGSVGNRRNYRTGEIVANKHVTGGKLSGSSALPLVKHHNGTEYCWLTQEDVLRFMVGSIAIFSPMPVMSIQDLNMIRTDVRMVGFEEDVVTALEMVKLATIDMTAVAIVDRKSGDPASVKLVGDISSCTLQACDETAALALATLSAGDFFVYTQDCKNAPDVLLELIYQKIGKISSKHQEGCHLLHDLELCEEAISSDDESGPYSPTGPHDLSKKWISSHSRSFKNGSSVKSRSGPIFCNPQSSVIAVLLQALAHREHYVWVTLEDDTLVGFVNLSDILTAMFNHINEWATKTNF